jgi:hypothetical protein
MILNKKEFIEGQGTALLSSGKIIVSRRHLSTLIEACILILTYLGHYNRFCHGSYGINRIHIRSWILASTSSLGRLFLQSGELIIATPAQRKTTRSVGWTNTPRSLMAETPTGNSYKLGAGHRFYNPTKTGSVSQICVLAHLPTNGKSTF